MTNTECNERILKSGLTMVDDETFIAVVVWAISQRTCAGSNSQKQIREDLQNLIDTYQE